MADRQDPKDYRRGPHGERLQPIDANPLFSEAAINYSISREVENQLESGFANRLLGHPNLALEHALHAERLLTSQISPNAEQGVRAAINICYSYLKLRRFKEAAGAAISALEYFDSPDPISPNLTYLSFALEAVCLLQTGEINYAQKAFVRAQKIAHSFAGQNDAMSYYRPLAHLTCAAYLESVRSDRAAAAAREDALSDAQSVADSNPLVPLYVNTVLARKALYRADEAGAMRIIEKNCLHASDTRYGNSALAVHNLINLAFALYAEDQIFEAGLKVTDALGRMEYVPELDMEHLKEAALACHRLRYYDGDDARYLLAMEILDDLSLRSHGVPVRCSSLELEALADAHATRGDNHSALFAINRASSALRSENVETSISFAELESKRLDFAMRVGDKESISDAAERLVEYAQNAYDLRHSATKLAECFVEAAYAARSLSEFDWSLTICESAGDALRKHGDENPKLRSSIHSLCAENLMNLGDIELAERHLELARKMHGGNHNISERAICDTQLLFVGVLCAQGKHSAALNAANQLSRFCDHSHLTADQRDYYAACVDIYYGAALIGTDTSAAKGAELTIRGIKKLGDSEVQAAAHLIPAYLRLADFHLKFGSESAAVQSLQQAIELSGPSKAVSQAKYLAFAKLHQITETDDPQIAENYMLVANRIEHALREIRAKHTVSQRELFFNALSAAVH